MEALLEEAKSRESARAADDAALREELEGKTRLCELAKQAGEDMEAQLASLRASSHMLSQRVSSLQVRACSRGHMALPALVYARLVSYALALSTWHCQRL